MLLSPLKTTVCGHKLLDSYVRGRKYSFVVKAPGWCQEIWFHCYKLPVCLNLLCFCAPLWSRGDRASPLPCLFSQLSGGGSVHCPARRTTGLLWSVSVVFPPDNVGQKHTVQQAGQPGKESTHIRKESVTSSACTGTHPAWEKSKS